MEFEMVEIVPPPVMAAITCRLRCDLKMGVAHSIPSGELDLMLRIIDAAVHCVKEWEPNEYEKSKGHGAGVGMRAAEDALIRLVRTDLPRTAGEGE